MAGGRPPNATVEEVVTAVALHPEPVVTAKDLMDDLNMTRRGTTKRLNQLVDDGYLYEKRVGSAAKVYWLTDKGRSLLPGITPPDAENG